MRLRVSVVIIKEIMEGSECMVPSCYDPYEGEKHVIAAAQHVVKALVATQNVSSDLRKILADLDIQLSKMNTLTERDVVGITSHETKDPLTSIQKKVISWQCEARASCEVEDRLVCAQRKVISWQSTQSMIWDSGPQEASEYLQAVDEVRRLAESLGNLLTNTNGKEKELLDRAQGVLQMAMVRLEEELINILSRNLLCHEPDSLSLKSGEEIETYKEESDLSTEGDSFGDTCRRESIGTEPEDVYIIDLVHPDVISDIKSIANVMFASNYDREFCEAFVSFWKDALEEYLIILGIESLSIADVMEMEWSKLNRMIKKWCRAMKIVVRYSLANGKRLFDQVLWKSQSMSSTCFLDTTKTSMLCFLNFGEAIAISSHQPERLFRIIDMYEVLASLVPEIDVIYVEDSGTFLRSEFHTLLQKLGDSVRAVVVQFGSMIGSCSSVTPFPKGGIHHITKYVMNYIKAMAEYSNTLNLLLDQETNTEENRLNIPSDEVSSPMAHCLRSATAMLVTNLDHKSNLYRNASLKHVFLMNNVHYMVKKVDDRKLIKLFGAEWIRNHITKFQHHATSYERTTWSPVLSLLRDEGNTRKANLKERYRVFNIAFEEAYKNQTGWLVQDPQLREDLQIKTSQMVIPAYRAFTGRASTYIGDKYVKYGTDDLEKYIMDLFEGTPKTLYTFWKR